MRDLGKHFVVGLGVFEAVHKPSKVQILPLIEVFGVGEVARPFCLGNVVFRIGT